MTKKIDGEIDADAEYLVELSSSITVGRSIVHPGPRVLLRGDVLKLAKAKSPSPVKAYKPA